MSASTASCPACAAASPCIVSAGLTGRPDIFECDAHGMFAAGVLTRKRKTCVKCGHLECPCCGTWCDTLVGEGADRDLCCDGECTYAETSLASTHD